jgi:DNA-directed RNA polymerase specialized sigma24 family protein
MSDVTQLLSAIEHGDARAAAQLLPLVYDELRRLAAGKLAHEKPGHTLQPTALVHEAYLRLVGAGAGARWDGRGHFFAAAAEAMRRRVDLRQIEAVADAPSEDLLALDEALNLLAEEDARKAELVKLRYFAGLSVEEAARCLGVSRATADRDWAYARAWLYDRVRGGSAGE